MTDMTLTDEFTKSLAQTPQQAKRLSDNLTRLKKTNDELVTVLGYPQTISDNLNKLYDTMVDVRGVLTIVSVIPEVGQAASALKTSLNLLIQEVKPAKEAAARIASEVKPLHDNLKKLGPIIEQGIKYANELEAQSSAFLKHFQAITACINSLPDGEVKDTAQTYLNQFSETNLPLVDNLNAVLDQTNTTIEKLYNALERLKAALNPMAAINKAIDKVMSVLGPIKSVLDELEHALMNIKIRPPLPYPVPVSLYEIFKALGTFADLAMKPIQALVDSVLKALNIRLPSIPGLSDLINLDIDLPDLPDFGGIVSDIEDFINKIKSLADIFQLDCPPKKGQTDFHTQIGKG